MSRSANRRAPFSPLRRALLAAASGSALPPVFGTVAHAVAGAPASGPGGTRAVTTLALRGGSRQAAPFMAGVCLRPGDVPAGRQLQVDGAQAQATVKNRHADGSVAFAIVAGHADLQAGRPTLLQVISGAPSATTAAPLTLADLQRAGVALSIEAEGFGAASWSGAGWDRPAETWISGPRMSSWVFAQRAGSDAHLMLRMEVCLYANGEVEVFPYVENGWVMVPGATHKSARFIVKMNGSTRFDRMVALGHHTRTPLIDGTAMGYWNVAEPRIAPKQERAHLVATGRVVRPDPTADFPRWTGPANRTFQPFQLGLFRNGMYGGGHYDGLGPQPGWEVAYLASDDPLAYESMLRQGWSWGRYGIHYRDEKTGRPIAFSDHPTTQIAGQAQGSHHITELDTFHTLSYTPVPSGPMPGGDDYYAISHSPAPPYGAYLASGRHYLMEQCQFQATANFLAKGMSRNRSDGLCLYSMHQLRATAWFLRTLFLAAVATPDDHPLKREFQRSVKVNVDFYWQRVAGQPNNPFGTIPQYGAGVALQTFQHDFLVGSWGLGLAAQAAGDGPTRQRMAEVFQYLAKGTVGRLGGTGRDEFLYVHQSGQQADPKGPDGPAPVIVPSPAGVDPSTVDFEKGTGPWCASWGEIFRNAVGFPNPGVAGPLAFGDYPDPGGYWAQMHLALDECDRHQAAGTAAALARLRAATNYGELGAAIQSQGLMVCSRTTLAGARRVVAAAPMNTTDWQRFRSPAGEVHIINLDGLEDVDPERRAPSPGRWHNGYGNHNMIDSMTQSWSFGAAAKDHPDGLVQLWHGGGHGAAIAVTALQWKARTRRYGFIGWPRNVPDDEDWTGFRSLKVNADQRHDPKRDRRDEVWYDFDYRGSRIFIAAHAYKMLAYCPPGPGIGPQGALVIGALQWGNDPNTPPPRHPLPVLRHHMDLATGVVQRGSRSPPVPMGAPENNAFCRDTRRNRLWHFRHGTLECWYEDLDEPPPRLLKPHTMARETGAPPLPAVRYIGLRYIAELDIVLAQGGHADAAVPMAFYVLDMRSGFPVLAAAAAAPPPRRMPHGGCMAGFDYVPPLNAVYFYEGRRSMTMAVLQLDGTDWRQARWQWRTERWTGAVPPGVDKAPGMSNAEYNDALYSPAERFNYDADSGMLICTHGSTEPMRCVDGVMRQGGVAGFGLPGRVVPEA